MDLIQLNTVILFLCYFYVTLNLFCSFINLYVIYYIHLCISALLFLSCSILNVLFQDVLLHAAAPEKSHPPLHSEKQIAVKGKRNI
jgi:hypothetical protein